MLLAALSCPAHNSRNTLSTDSSLLHGYIAEIKKAGVYPTVGLGLFALVSKELFVLDPAELLLTFNMALLGTGLWVFGTDLFNQELTKERVKYYQTYIDTFKAQRDLAQAQLEICAATKAIPTITEEVYYAFKEANEAAAKARDIKARAAYRATTVAKLQSILKSEQEVLATQRAAVQNEALSVVMDALKEPKVRAAMLEEAIGLIGLRADSPAAAKLDGFKAVNQVVEDTLKSVRAKVAATGAKKA